MGRRRRFRLHAQVGTFTNVIASVEATESSVGDSVMLAPLLASSVERGFDVRELSADKASNDNLVAIEAAMGVPYIPSRRARARARLPALAAREVGNWRNVERSLPVRARTVARSRASTGGARAFPARSIREFPPRVIPM